jgi:hypothetical protein
MTKPPALEKTPPVESMPAAAAEPPATKVEEVRPSVYYLPDKQGNLQAVLDFNYEDFIELYKLKQRLAKREALPRYSIQRMSINGTAGSENAELTIQFQIMVRDADWTRVPLRLDQGLLREPAEYQGPGEHFVHFDGNGDGYVSWIRGKKEGLHEITLKMLVPLSPAGEERKLRIFTPRAAVSEMKLKIPEPGAVGTVSEGATLLPPSAAEQDGTLFTALGLGGEFQLAWHKAEAKIAEVPAVLEAAGNILIRLDSQGIISEATLSVHSYASPFDRFVVRLPTDAEFSPSSAPGYSILPLEGKRKRTAGRQWSKSDLIKKPRARWRFTCPRGGTSIRNSSPRASIWLVSRSWERCGNGARSPWRSAATGRSCGGRSMASGRPIYCPNRCTAKEFWPVLNIPLILIR